MDSYLNVIDIHLQVHRLGFMFSLVYSFCAIIFESSHFHHISRIIISKRFLVIMEDHNLPMTLFL